MLSTLSNFTFIGVQVAVWNFQKCKFYEIWGYNHSAGCVSFAVLAKFSVFVSSSMASPCSKFVGICGRALAVMGV